MLHRTVCRRTKKCTRVADRAFPEVKVSWRQPGDFGRYPTQMYNENPYSSTLFSDMREPDTRVRIALWWLVYLHPAITLALIYTCWILTTVALGRRPGFGEESGSLIVYRVTYVLGATGAILTVAGPILLPLSLLWGLCQPFAERFSEGSKTTKRVLCVGIYFLMLVFAAFVCHYDPFGALNWFWD